MEEIKNSEVSIAVKQTIESSTLAAVIPVDEVSANNTNDTESLVDQQDNKTLAGFSSEGLTTFASFAQNMAVASPGDFYFNQIIQAFYETYCG